MLFNNKVSFFIKFLILPHSARAETCENLENQRVNMMRSFLSMFVMVLFAASLSAQQDPQFTLPVILI